MPTAASETRIYRVAIPSPLRRLFDYLPPDVESETPVLEIENGTRVKVPFGNKKLIGIVVNRAENSLFPIEKLRPIIEIIDTKPLLPPTLFDLYLWAASYYQHPVGEALATALPSLLRKGKEVPTSSETYWQLTTKGKGLPEAALQKAPRQKQLLNALQQHSELSSAQIKAIPISRAVINQLADKDLIKAVTKSESIRGWTKENLLKTPPLALYPEQEAAVNNIHTEGFKSYLLHGETGSGKTEVYLQLIEKLVCSGKQVLILIPEISLTPQTLSRFQQRFNCPIDVIHSGLTDRERALAWNKARTGVTPIVLGTRSAIFTPLLAPGLLIVDEEHDNSFKQQDGFRYSARDVAVARAQKEDIPLILGSATPSLESLYNCSKGRYKKLTLSCRPGEAKQPQWQLVNLRENQLNSGFSAELIAAMEQELSAGNQVLVFLNRRGFAPTLSCQSCGWIADCHRCSARLTVHRRINRLLCHHCEHQEPVVEKCPNCFSRQLNFLGQGTERSESLLEAMFPNTPVLRVDRDSTRRKNAMQLVVDKVNTGESCILVGTQILAKGHHFPNVTLVAILDIDGGLFSPDFRAPERMGQLITQVAGRAGRGNKPGKVVLQSHYCDHPLITTLCQDGYAHFAQQLLNERELGQLPPFQYLCAIRSESHDLRQAQDFLAFARQQAEALMPASPQLSYLGPLPSPME